MASSDDEFRKSLKRRRQEERSSGIPDQNYIRNKRVLLSYGSEEEALNNVQQKPTISVPAFGLAAAMFDSAEPPISTSGDQVDGVDYVVEPEEETLVQDGDEDEQRSKKRRGFTRRKQQKHEQKPVVYEETGQHLSLGPVDLDSDLELDSDTTGDEAVAYLRSVRSERAHIPALLTARRHETQGAVLADSRAAYSNGVYAIRPNAGPAMPAGFKKSITPMEAYTAALLTRFDAVHDALTTEMTTGDSTSAQNDAAYHYDANDQKSGEAWLVHLTKETPPVQRLRQMKSDTVLNLLELIQDTVLSLLDVLEDHCGAWIMALLARLDGYGQMHMEKLAIIRRFAKEAALLQQTFRERAPEAEAVRDAEESAGERVSSEMTGEGDNVPETTMGATSSMSSTTKALAILDMIIVIIGERFGQRDLLESRQWPLG